MRADGALVWARSDRPARLVVETAATESFTDPVRHVGGLLTPETDGTGRLRLTGLPAGEQVHYRVVLEGEDGATSEPVTGLFRTAPTAPGDIRLQWSGDTAGQGFGINPDIGGMTIFDTMARRDPHLFVHSGDVVYADNPLKETVELPDGRIWRNVVTEAKSAVAQTLDEYRGQYAYNLMDENYRRFNSSVAQIVQWDDHETVNNWYAGEILDLEQYTEKRVDVLAERAFRAFHECSRSIRRRPSTDASTGSCGTDRCSTSSYSTCGPTRTPTVPTSARRGRCSAARRRSGSSTNSPVRLPPGRSSPPTSRSVWSYPTVTRPSKGSRTGTTALRR